MLYCLSSAYVTPERYLWSAISSRPHVLDCRHCCHAIDHRKVAPGTVLGAFAGSRFNGEDFIPAAVESGAVAVVARPEARVEGAVHGTCDNGHAPSIASTVPAARPSGFGTFRRQECTQAGKGVRIRTVRLADSPASFHNPLLT